MSEFLSGFVNRAGLSKCQRFQAKAESCSVQRTRFSMNGVQWMDKIVVACSTHCGGQCRRVQHAPQEHFAELRGISFVDEQFIEGGTIFPQLLSFSTACTLPCPAMVTEGRTRIM